MTTTPAESARRCVVCHAQYPGTERFCPIDGGAIVVTQPAFDVEESHLGKTIDGRYLVRRLIGRGGMGSVYEADHIGLDKRVAIKFLLGDTTDRDVLARFRREARVASKIVHENVVQIFDVGTENGVAFIVMEYVEGHDLKQTLADGALDPPRALALARQILRGVDAIHRGGIVHRDIKPANILLTAGGDGRDVVKIMDFGISKELYRVTRTLTGTGEVIGTPQYMSPEQLCGAEVDPRSDLYAVGLVLHEMLAGPSTLDGASSSALAAMHLSQPPLSLERAGLPAAVVAAVKRALANAPSDRFPDARAFADALDTPGIAASADRAGAREAATVRQPQPAPASPKQRPIAIVPTPVAVESRAEASTAIGRPSPNPKQLDRGRVGSTRSRRWQVAGAGAVIAAAVAFLIAHQFAGRVPASAAWSDAARGSAQVAAEQRGVARGAEDRGELELAIAAYQEVYAAAPDADSLYRIGELYERLGKRAEAATYFDRYLTVRPEASDRAVVVERMARLRAVTVDARVIDAGLTDAIVQAGPKPQRCECVKDNQTSALCRRLTTALLCACVRVTEDANYLCPQRFVAGVCPVADYAFFKLRATPGAPCSGYWDPNNSEPEPLPGHYRCELCPEEKDSHMFRGRRGTACEGYDNTASSLPERKKGHLDNCKD